MAVAVAAVGSDQQFGGARVARRAKFVPPASDARDGEDGGVVADVDGDLPCVGGDIVDAIRHRLAGARDREVMHLNRCGAVLGRSLQAYPKICVKVITKPLIEGEPVITIRNELIDELLADRDRTS